MPLSINNDGPIQKRLEKILLFWEYELFWMGYGYFPVHSPSICFKTVATWLLFTIRYMVIIYLITWSLRNVNNAANRRSVCQSKANEIIVQPERRMPSKLTLQTRCIRNLCNQMHFESIQADQVIYALCILRMIALDGYCGKLNLDICYWLKIRFSIPRNFPVRIPVMFRAVEFVHEWIRSPW